jgi:hypothetical protein
MPFSVVTERAGASYHTSYNRLCSSELDCLALMPLAWYFPGTYENCNVLCVPVPGEGDGFGTRSRRDDWHVFSARLDRTWQPSPLPIPWPRLRPLVDPDSGLWMGCSKDSVAAPSTAGAPSGLARPYRIARDGLAEDDRVVGRRRVVGSGRRSAVDRGQVTCQHATRQRRVD